MVGLHEQSEEMLELSLDRCLEIVLPGRNRGLQIRASESDEASSPSVDHVGSVLVCKHCKAAACKRRAALDHLSDDHETATVDLIWMRSGDVTHSRPGISIASSFERQRNSAPNCPGGAPTGGAFIEHGASGCTGIIVEGRSQGVSSHGRQNSGPMAREGLWQPR